MSKWQEITPDFVHFENKGDSVEGKLTSVSELRIKNIPVKKWVITKSNGTLVSFLGGVSLDPMLEAIPFGTEIKLVFDSRVKLDTGYAVKTFKLFQSVPDVPAPAAIKK